MIKIVLFLSADLCLISSTLEQIVKRNKFQILSISGTFLSVDKR